MESQKADKGVVFQQLVKNIALLLKSTQRDEQVLLEKVNDRTHIIKDLGIDSIEIMDLIGMLEKEFSVTFDIKKFGQGRTLGDLVGSITDQLAERNK